MHVKNMRFDSLSSLIFLFLIVAHSSLSLDMSPMALCNYNPNTELKPAYSGRALCTVWSPCAYEWPQILGNIIIHNTTLIDASILTISEI